MSKALFYLDRKSSPAGVASTCMVMSAIFCIFGSIQGSATILEMLGKFLFPVITSLLFLLCIVIFGKTAFWVSSFPVVLWCGYAIYKSFDAGNKIFTVVMIIIYVLLAAVYCCTLFGAIRAKWLGAVLFLIPALFSIFVLDWPVIVGKRAASFSSIMLGMSTITVLFGIAFALLGLRVKDVASIEKSKGIIPPIPGGKAVKSDLPQVNIIPEQAPSADAQQVVESETLNNED